MTDNAPRGTTALLSADQVIDLNKQLFRSIGLIIGINNKFVEIMQASETLHDEDRQQFEAWSKAVARAHRMIGEKLELLNGPSQSDGLQ